MKRALVVSAVLLATLLFMPQPARLVRAQDVTSVPPAGVVRYLAGGDSRDDKAHVLPWAFHEAKERGAKAFFYLGDMELTPELDNEFKNHLKYLQGIPFYPALGNHEIAQFGIFRSGIIERLTGGDPEKVYRRRFLDTKETPVHSSFNDKVVYGVNLDGGLHFIALDNVSQKGFGDSQLKWLETDLKAARQNPATKHIIVGMHKALAKNGNTTHAMDEDGAGAIADSDRALALFQTYHVELILQSHKHAYDRYTQGGITSIITGGLGAPLPVKALSHDTADHGAFHHFLQLDVADSGITVTVVKFPGPSSFKNEPGDAGQPWTKPGLIVRGENFLKDVVHRVGGFFSHLAHWHI